MSDVQNPAAYVIKKGRPSGFRFVIAIGGKDEMVAFEHGRYDCPTAEHEAAIEALMLKPQFTQNIVKVDKEAADAIARAHMEANRPSAVQGGMTSDGIKLMENDVARQNAEDIADALAKENLMTTETVVPPKTTGVNELQNVVTDPVPAVTIGNKINIGSK